MAPAVLGKLIFRLFALELLVHGHSSYSFHAGRGWLVLPHRLQSDLEPKRARPSCDGHAWKHRPVVDCPLGHALAPQRE